MNKIASALVAGLLAASLAPAAVLAQPGAAAAPAAAAGTWDDCNTNPTVSVAGPNLIVTVEITENYFGTLTGTYVGTERDVVYPNGSATFHGSGIFRGSVDGLTGTARMSYEGFFPTTGVLPATGPGSAKWVLVGETGELASVTARGTWGGTFLGVSGACGGGLFGGTYSGQVVASNSCAHSGTLLPRTAVNSELRPSGSAVSTAAPASAAAGSRRFSAVRSPSE